MKEIRVKNIPNTGDEKCEGGCSSWREHWENASLLKATFCCVKGCLKTEGIEGGHVEVVASNGVVYIVPLCPKHNNPDNEEVMIIEPSVADIALVPARQQLSCGSRE